MQVKGSRGLRAWGPSAAEAVGEDPAPSIWCAARMVFGACGRSRVCSRTRQAGTGLSRGPGCSCFAAGTLIETDDGLRPIETLHPGDMVLSRDERSGETAYRPVLHTFVTPDRALDSITLTSSRGVVETLTVTPNHPFWVEGSGWRRFADELTTQSSIATSAAAELGVASAVALRRRGTTYNHEVRDVHPNIVGRTPAWVHNLKPKALVPPGATRKPANRAPPGSRDRWSELFSTTDPTTLVSSRRRSCCEGSSPIPPLKWPCRPLRASAWR